MPGAAVGRAVFPRIDYLHWIEGRPAAAAHDLGTTNQRLGDALDRLCESPDPPGPLEAQLATELGVGEERLLVTAGTTHANFLATAVALEAGGDAVLVESPGYEPLAAMPEGFGATVRRFGRPAADGFAIDPARVEAAIDDDVALVAVTDRHNPSGRPADPDALVAVARLAQDHGARLLVDEVYAPFAAGDGPNFGAGTAAAHEGAIATGALTKFFGLGELRIGWLVGPPAFVERAREVSAHVPTVSGVTRRLASRLLADRDAQVAVARARAAANADLLSAFVDGRDELDGEIHGACPFGFVRHDRADGDAVANAAWDAGVLVVPGRFFGDEGRFRLAAAGPAEETRRALDAFGEVLDGQ